MSNELTGRALDDACARVIWLGGDIDHPEHPAHGRAYSTAPATIPEMTAWLRQHFALVDIGVYKDGEVWARGSIDDVDTINMESSGNNINEALARLVVEVARARGKQ